MDQFDFFIFEEKDTFMLNNSSFANLVCAHLFASMKRNLVKFHALAFEFWSLVLYISS